MAEKLERAMTTFHGGVNTARAAHLLEDNELRRAEWADMTADGVLVKARGLTALSDELGPGRYQGLHVHVTRDGQEVILLVWNNRLYRLDGQTFTELPVRMYPPVITSVTVGTTGSAEFTADADFFYRVYAVKGGGLVASEDVKVTMGATAHPITLTIQGTYGAEWYRVYRRQTSDPRPDPIKGQWDLVGDFYDEGIDVGGGRLESGAVWVDDGQGGIANRLTGEIVPSTTNSTSMLIPERCSFVSQGERTYILGGDGLLWTDGRDAGVVQPAPYDATYGPNSLRLFTEPVHKCRALAWHQTYAFALNNQFEPTKMYYSRLGRWDYWPSLAVIDAPDSQGGRLLHAGVLYNVLSVSGTTGRWTLHGKTFTPNSGNFDGFWSKVSSLGVRGPSSIARIPAAGRDLMVCAGPDTNIHVLYADTAVEAYMNARPVANQIRESVDAEVPSLGAVRDWDNAAAIYHRRRYIISFPADGVVWVGYPDVRSDGQFAWFGPRSGISIAGWGVRTDGSLIGMDANNGTLYRWEDGYTLPNGSPYTMRVRTKEFINLLRAKKLRRAYIKGKQESVLTTCRVRVHADADVKESMVDFNANAVIGTAMVGDAVIGYVEAPLELTGLRATGRSTAYEIESTAAQPLTIYGIYELYSLKKPR